MFATWSATHVFIEDLVLWGQFFDSFVKLDSTLYQSLSHITAWEGRGGERGGERGRGGGGGGERGGGRREGGRQYSTHSSVACTHVQCN